MKKAFLLFLIFFTTAIMSQEGEKRSYYFDFYKIKDGIQDSENSASKVVTFYNTNDSTYTLNLNYKLKKAYLADFNSKELVRFDFNFDFKQVKDLNKLKNATLYKDIKLNNHINSNDNYYKNVEYQNDSVTNYKTIVHIQDYKNNKMKKLISEHFYVFGDNSKLIDKKDIAFRYSLINKYKIESINNQFLERMVFIKEDKIIQDIQYLEEQYISFNFDFSINSLLNIKEIEIETSTENNSSYKPLIKTTHGKIYKYRK